MPVEKLFPDVEIRDLPTSGATIHCLRLDLALHRLEVSLDAIHSHPKAYRPG